MHSVKNRLYEVTRERQIHSYAQTKRGSKSTLCLLTDPAGRTFPRFSAEKSITGGGAAEEIGFGDRAMVTAPSGPYFLGLPLFFFPAVASAPAAAMPGGEPNGVAQVASELSLCGRIPGEPGFDSPWDNSRATQSERTRRKTS
nr:hypothetical protein CR513_22049 [Ipomoea trifida]